MGHVGYITASPTISDRLLGTANSLVSYAQGRISTVDKFVEGLSGAVLSLQAPPITPEFPVGASAPAISVAPLPEFPVAVWRAPGFPTPLIDILEIGDLQVAPFDDNPPEINYGTAPPEFVGQLPDAPAINLTFEDPTLTVTLPPAPELLRLNIEKFGGLNLPTFDAADPVLTAVEPSIREYIPGKQYTSALLEGLKTTLEERITSGGTGLTQEVENAIWDRGREREARSKGDTLRALENMEALGYSVPPGIYLDARLRIETETDYANRGHSREVMIKSAELMLDNVKHALTTSVQLEGQLIDYTNAVETRVFESTKYATEAGIQIYNAKVSAYGAMVQAYQGKVAVYEARVRAEVSKVDAYRATIAAEEAKASINRTLVEQYKVQVDVALSNIEIYKAEIAGIQAKAAIEQTKVQVFGEQVRGFTAQVNAYTAGVEGYRARLQGEQTKQQVYQSQVQVFSARVDANAKQIDARIAVLRAKIDAKNGEYDGYKAAVAGESARTDAISKQAGTIADAYRSQVTAVGSYNDTLTKQWQATLDQNQRTAEIAVSAAKANAELYITTRSLALDAAKAGATVSAQIGAAALNAVNYSGSVSASESISNSASNSGSNSDSNSISDSKSTSYNYNASV